MKILTAEILRYVMPNASANNCAVYAELINQYAGVFGITTDIQLAHYLAQIAHESAELKYTEEIASGAAYEGRKDLGNVYPGDGKKFKGRGLIQITGHANYKAYNDYLTKTGMKVDLLKSPTLLSAPLGATKSSLWFCKKHGVFDAALMDNGTTIVKSVKDRGKLKTVTVNATLLKITRIVNGGYNGIEERNRYLRKAKYKLGV